ncbi:hypothetical protein F444_00329, partial [Phytophthora nicotianae P1976]
MAQEHFCFVLFDHRQQRSAMSAARSRHHLTIADKNRLRRHHQQHPELTQEQLREWAYAAFGQWVARSTVGHIVRAPEE